MPESSSLDRAVFKSNNLALFQELNSVPRLLVGASGFLAQNEDYVLETLSPCRPSSLGGQRDTSDKSLSLSALPLPGLARGDEANASPGKAQAELWMP